MARVTAEELALRVGIPPRQVDDLAEREILDRDANGRFDPGDVHRLRCSGPEAYLPRGTAAALPPDPGFGFEDVDAAVLQWLGRVDLSRVVTAG